MTGFIFGGNTPWSYEDLQKKRTIAEELVRANMSTPRNVGEGLNAIGRALAFRSIDKKASKRDAELKGEFQSQWDGAFGGLGGGQAFAPPTFGSAPLPPVDPNNPHALGDDTMAALGKPAIKTAADPAAIKAGLVARGLPEHVAEGFVMNMQDESGLNPGINEAAPLVPGSRGGFGLYQLTGPRRVAYERFAAERGVPVDDVDAQLDFLMTELQGPEAKAAGAILSTKTPGEAGAAIVNNFLRPAPQHASARTAEYLGGAQPGAQPGGGMDLATIAELAGSPYATPGQKAVLAALMQQQMDAMDPMRAIEMQKAQLELAQMQNPEKPKPIEVNGVLLDPLTFEPIYDGRTPPAPDKPPTSVQEYEFYKQGAIARGEEPMTYEAFLVADEKASVPPGAAPGLPPDEEALRGALGKKEGESWSAALDAANISAGTVQDFEFLDELITMAPQGPIQGRLAGAFPGVSSAADAFTSVVKRVAPTLRAPGSGATSDIEYEGMLKSLPQLSSKPEANRAISAMMKAKAQINIERGQVIARYQNGEIGAPEARKALTELNSRSIMTPELKAILGQTAPPQPGSDMSEDDAAYLRSLGLEP